MSLPSFAFTPARVRWLTMSLRGLPVDDAVISDHGESRIS